MDLKMVRNLTAAAVRELLEDSSLPKGSVFVLGCSSSEISGGHIGKSSNKEIGETVIEAVLPLLEERSINLAVQCCEHLNRALVIERKIAEKFGFEIVNAVPALHAGGACALAAYKRMSNPVLVEKITAEAGIDIGDTFIGMHLKHVAVPVRLGVREIGGARVTAAKSRPKLIGGERAVYELQKD